MKRLIISALLVASTCIAMAQAPKAPEEKHPNYVPDLTFPLSAKLNVTTGQANSFLIVAQNGGPELFINTDKITSAEAQAHLKGYRTVIDSLAVGIFKNLNKWNIEALAKFKADTTKLYHPEKVKPAIKN